MIPRLSWRNRLRLAIAVLRGDVYPEPPFDLGERMAWGQRIWLRTVKDIEVLREPGA